MVKDGPQHFEQHPLEPSLAGESLSGINTPYAAGTAPEPQLKEDHKEEDLEAEIEKARLALAEIEAGLQAGTGDKIDPKARDRAKIEVVYLERKILGSQWRGVDTPDRVDQSSEINKDNPPEKGLPEEG